jgi:hypothetical protein
MPGRAPATMPTAVERELDRQAGVLLEHGIPQLLGQTSEGFALAVEALRPVLAVRVTPPGSDPALNRVSFALVVSAGVDQDLAAAERLVPLLRRPGSSDPGVLDRNHGAEGLATYRPTAEAGSPPAPVYALVDVDRGEEFRGVRPQDALPVILARGRTPLTIPEGIALVLLHPRILAKNACFMLSGSRRGDRRVPALWISGKAVKLGWCWDGNPHTWLGVASTADRIPSPDFAST